MDVLNTYHEITVGMSLYRFQKLLYFRTILRKAGLHDAIKEAV
jgi:hypothetical protein